MLTDGTRFDTSFTVQKEMAPGHVKTYLYILYGSMLRALMHMINFLPRADSFSSRLQFQFT